MPTLQTDAATLHFQHRLWQNELSFFQDELEIFQNGLGKLVTRTLDRDTLAKLEHFQNQFIRQKEVLDQLKRDIKVHDQQLARLLKKDGSTQVEDTSTHRDMDEKMASFRSIYHDLKVEFHKFMAANLR